MRKLGILLAALVLTVYCTRAAANVIYSVERTLTPGKTVFGPPAQVKGTITTDGTFGFLTPSNILDWNLSLTTGPYQLSVDPSNSLLDFQTVDPTLYNQGLFAGPSGLDFVFGPAFSSLYSTFGIWGGSSVSGDTSLPNFFAWCIGTNFCNNDFGIPDELVLIRFDNDESRTVAEYGTTDRENLAAPVPLPGGILLLASAGLMAAAGSGLRQVRRRRKQAPRLPPPPLRA